MADVPYAWVLVLVAAAFVVGTVTSALRFVRSGGQPSHAVGMLLFGVLAIITGWVAWVAVTGPPLP
ncbi:MAG TPA: hypothetical protein VF367_06315 [Candidatus Limnocylindria bacterium]